MAITIDDFSKIWASTSPLTPYSFSASQYKEGWNFIGSTPPSRQMWDFLQKNNDEKMQYLLNHFDHYLPLSGGTLTGVVNGVTPPKGDNSKKLATTEFVTATAQQADWNVTDSTSKAFIKNKPNVVTYKFFPYNQTAEWESNCVQSITEGMATDHPAAYKYGTQVTLGVIGHGANARIYFPHNGGMYLKNFWDNNNSSGWLTMLSNKNFADYALPKDGTAVKATNATNDANGNPIAGTYLPLAGGTMTGSIQYVENGKVFAIGHTDPGNVDLGWNWANSEGAGIGLRSVDHLKTPGGFNLYARDSANSCSLEGKPDGSLTWDNKDVERVNASGSNYIRYESGLQIVWGGTTATTSGTTVTFPVAFKDTTYRITGTARGYLINVGWASSTPTSIKFTTSVSSSDSSDPGAYLEYILIGQWK